MYLRSVCLLAQHNLAIVTQIPLKSPQHIPPEPPETKCERKRISTTSVAFRPVRYIWHALPPPPLLLLRSSRVSQPPRRHHSFAMFMAKLLGCKTHSQFVTVAHWASKNASQRRACAIRGQMLANRCARSSSSSSNCHIAAAAAAPDIALMCLCVCVFAQPQRNGNTPPLLSGQPHPTRHLFNVERECVLVCSACVVVFFPLLFIFFSMRTAIRSDQRKYDKEYGKRLQQQQQQRCTAP